MSAVLRPATVIGVFPRSRARSAGMVVGFTLLTAVAAQITLPVPWTPVPVTAQTLSVLLAGGTLGWRNGALSQLLYVLVGAVGLPFFHDAQGGWAVVSGPTGGYLVGFIAAAALVGCLAEQGQDRRLLTCLPAMLAGTAIVYVFGVPWLAHVLNVDTARAITLGLAPFVVGDAAKLLVAGVLLPAAWTLVGDER